LIAIARKILVIANAVLRDQTPSKPEPTTQLLGSSQRERRLLGELPESNGSGAHGPPKQKWAPLA
ncbi:hypothetical protein, partial [Devosia sp. Leaf64]|uniref:hypothetical protein n=1 Tax=Devosia sp. Leaf64 TaxID=1736229 RepID=UPI001AEC4FD5